MPVQVRGRGRALNEGDGRSGALQVGLECRQDHARIAERRRALSTGGCRTGCSSRDGHDCEQGCGGWGGRMVTWAWLQRWTYSSVGAQVDETLVGGGNREGKKQ